MEFIRLRRIPRLLAVDECESKSRGATADVACKLAWADNPDEYAEIIEENFGISTSRGTLRNHGLCPWGSIETPVFTKRIVEILTDDEYRSLQEKLVENPNAGKLIPHGKGLRKYR